jgi:heat shock protein HslJ
MRLPLPSRLFLLPIVALLAAACAGGTAASDPPTSAAPSEPPASADPGGSEPGGPVDATGEWRLVEATIDGAPLELPADAPVTLTIDGTQVGGRSACNSYFGDIVVENGEVRFGQMGMTMMACEEPAMSIETAYHGALGRIRVATMEGETLVLAGDGVSLRFEPVPPVPTAELVDTLWTLDTLITGEVATSVAGDPATLRIASDLSFEGSTGCRSFDGRLTETGGTLTATEMAMTDQACPPELAAQDAHVTSVLGDGFSPAVEGARLTLTSAGGQGLGYTAAE